jgi:hypothetical protein
MKKNPISFGSLIRPANSGQNPPRNKILYFHTKYLNGNILSFTYPNQAIQRLKFIYIDSRGDHFLLGLVFIKKSNQPDFFKKTKTGSNRPVSVHFGLVFLDKNWFGLVYSVWLGFDSFWLGFFPVWVRFGLFFSVSGL